MNENCPFCEIVASDKDGRLVAMNDWACAMLDAYPISDGHTLIIPKRHIGSIFGSTMEERQAMWELLEKQKGFLDETMCPVAFNIGINDGAAAGQTVDHLHIHLIPRYHGDIADPRGGIRWIFPDKAKYW